MANQKSYKHFKFCSFAVCVVSIILLLGALFYSGDFSSFEGSFWLALLFVMPVLIQIFGLWHLDSKFESDHHLLSPTGSAGMLGAGEGSPQTTSMLTEAEKVERIKALVTYSKFYLSAMTTCLCSYSFLWLVYAFAQSRYGWETLAWQKGEDIRLTWWMSDIYFGFSLFALTIIGILLLMVMWMARAIIGEVQHKTSRFEFLNRYYLKHGAAEAPFLTLIFFLTIFLGVSYLFGFAFAFHDKTQFYKEGNKTNVTKPALVMTNLIMPHGELKTAATPSPSPSLKPIATIKFDVGTSKPSSEAAAELSTAVSAIQQMSTDDRPLRIVLIGGADLLQIRSLAYQSNYELAEARALNVKHKILERLSASPDSTKLRNLEWTCLAEPHEGQITNSNPTNSKSRPDSVDDEGQNDRTVKVFAAESYEMPTGLLVRNLRANHLKPLSLMDYVYFANYTITTTGYGDIVPNTIYAKFICSLANISEVLFLVVFFNALLSVGGIARISTMARQMGELHAKYLR